jgi:hypothetical protein
LATSSDRHSRSSCFWREPDPNHPVEHGHCGRNRATRPDRVLDVVGDAPVVTARQSVSEDRAFQGHDGPSIGERLRHLRLGDERRVRSHARHLRERTDRDRTGR